RDNWYADSGLIAAVIGLYVATLSGKRLSYLRKQYSHYHVIIETNFDVDDKQTAIQRIKDAFSSEKQDELDGISIFLPDDSWFNVRPSNTESILRLNAEVKILKNFEQIFQKVK